MKWNTTKYVCVCVWERERERETFLGSSEELDVFLCEVLPVSKDTDQSGSSVDFLLTDSTEVTADVRGKTHNSKGFFVFFLKRHLCWLTSIQIVNMRVVQKSKCKLKNWLCFGRFMVFLSGCIYNPAAERQVRDTHTHCWWQIKHTHVWTPVLVRTLTWCVPVRPKQSRIFTVLLFLTFSSAQKHQRLQSTNPHQHQHTSHRTDSPICV